MSLPASCGTVRFTAAESSLPHVSLLATTTNHTDGSQMLYWDYKALCFYSLGTLLLASNARDDTRVTSAWHWYPIRNNVYCVLVTSQEYLFVANEVLAWVHVNSTTSWDVTSCGLVVHWRFGETYWLRLQGRNIGESIPIGNSRYRKYKESAHMACSTSPISQPSLDISPIRIPLFSNEVSNSTKICVKWQTLHVFP
jgi:hypothetical protein